MSKQIVQYDEKAGFYMLDEMDSQGRPRHRRAVLYPINHPSHLVSNEKPVLTSRVLYVSPDGRIKTENTIYVPQGDL